MNKREKILRRNRIFGLLTVICLMIVMVFGTVTVMAGDTDELNEKPTYTIRVFGGDQGTINGAAVISVTEGTSIESVLSSVQIRDDRYYAKDVRVSGGGENNNELLNPTDSIPAVQQDTDYVIVYGMKKESVAYTIQYLKADGSGELVKSMELYGKVGEVPVVAAKHIEGFYPNARNLKDSRGLSEDPANNVFRFWYQPMPEEVIQVVSGGWYGGTNGTAYAGGTNGTAFASGTNGTAAAGITPLIPTATGNTGTEATGTTGSAVITGRTGMSGYLTAPDRLPATPGEVPYMLDLANNETLLFAPGTNTTGIAGANMTNTTGIAGVNMTNTAIIAGENVTGIIGENITGIAGENVTGIAGENTTYIAGENATGIAGENTTDIAGENITDAAGANMTEAIGPDVEDAADTVEEEVIDTSSGIPGGLLGGIIGAAAAAVIAVVVISRKRR